MARPCKFGKVPTTVVRVTIPTTTAQAIQAYADAHFDGDLSLAVERACAVLSGRDGEAYRLRDLEQQRWRDELRADWNRFRKDLADHAKVLRTNKRLRKERKIARREAIALKFFIEAQCHDSEYPISRFREEIESSMTETEFSQLVERTYFPCQTT